MWSIEHSLLAPVSKEQVWEAWRNVEDWNTWDDGVAWSKMDGPFAVGTIYLLKPKDGPKVRATITRCEPLQGFTDLSFLPLCRLAFDHHVAEVEGGVKLTHRASMSGPTTFLFRRLIGNNIERDLPRAMGRLVERARSL